MRPTSVARALQGLIPPKIATPNSVVSLRIADLLWGRGEADNPLPLYLLIYELPILLIPTLPNPPLRPSLPGQPNLHHRSPHLNPTLHTSPPELPPSEPRTSSPSTNPSPRVLLSTRPAVLGEGISRARTLAGEFGVASIVG